MHPIQQAHRQWGILRRPLQHKLPQGRLPGRSRFYLRIRASRQVNRSTTGQTGSSESCRKPETPQAHRQHNCFCWSDGTSSPRSSRLWVADGSRDGGRHWRRVWQPESTSTIQSGQWGRRPQRAPDILQEKRYLPRHAVSERDHWGHRRPDTTDNRQEDQESEVFHSDRRRNNWCVAQMTHLRSPSKGHMWRIWGPEWEKSVWRDLHWCTYIQTSRLTWTTLSTVSARRTDD